MSDDPVAIATAILRAQNSTRDRMLDFVIGTVAFLMIYLVFREYWVEAPPPRNLVVNDDPSTIVAPGTRGNSIYTYNMPAGRRMIANNVGPTGVSVPANPSQNPDYVPANTPASNGQQ